MKTTDERMPIATVCIRHRPMTINFADRSPHERDSLASFCGDRVASMRRRLDHSTRPAYALSTHHLGRWPGTLHGPLVAVRGYDRARQQPKHRWFPWSVRVHHILREDRDRDLHDHPWHARTIILQGGYVELRLIMINTHGQVTERIERRTGTCAALRPGEYHRIDQVAAGGAYTLFITCPKSCDWGFLVNGESPLGCLHRR